MKRRYRPRPRARRRRSRRSPAAAAARQSRDVGAATAAAPDQSAAARRSPPAAPSSAPSSWTARGRTLYLFEKDKGAHEQLLRGVRERLAAADDGAKGVARRRPAAPPGSARRKRTDGKTEITYAGHPLYTYAGDAKPGDVQGPGPRPVRRRVVRPRAERPQDRRRRLVTRAAAIGSASRSVRATSGRSRSSGSASCISWSTPATPTRSIPTIGIALRPERRVRGAARRGAVAAPVQRLPGRAGRLALRWRAPVGSASPPGRSAALRGQRGRRALRLHGDRIAAGDRAVDRARSAQRSSCSARISWRAGRR